MEWSKLLSALIQSALLQPKKPSGRTASVVVELAVVLPALKIGKSACQTPVLVKFNSCVTIKKAWSFEIWVTSIQGFKTSTYSPLIISDAPISLLISANLSFFSIVSSVGCISPITLSPLSRPMPCKILTKAIVARTVSSPWFNEAAGLPVKAEAISIRRIRGGVASFILEILSSLTVPKLTFRAFDSP